MLGEVVFCSGKAARLLEENKGRCRAFMYVMHVSEELASWPERHKRTRLWVRAQRQCVTVLHVLAASKPNVGTGQLSVPCATAQCSLEEALRRIRHDWMKAALMLWIERSGWTLPCPRALAAHDDHTMPQRIAAQN